MKICKTLFLIIGIFFTAGNVLAVPAYPYLIKKKQPDGQEITLRMKGDENMKWMESEDGYSLLYNENRFIVYAVQNDVGDMIASDIVAENIPLRNIHTNNFLKEIPKKLRYSTRQQEIFRQMEVLREKTQLKSSGNVKATIGNAKAVCALIEFPDKPFRFTRQDFDLLMNQMGYVNGIQKGSVRDYYFENSYGQLDLTVTVAGPYKAKNNYSYYGENRSDNYDHRPGELAKEAADFTFNDLQVNPEDYDNDGDGFIDTFHFIFAGHGEESGADSDCIWSHRSYFFTPLHYKNKKLEGYSCSPELRDASGKNITYIGVICHELCHVFGAPDFYDTDGKFSGGEFLGTGDWDLMASGSWNNQGSKPAHINMYQKIQFGWVKPTILSSPTYVKEMSNSAENPVAYIIESHIKDEYYVLENRQKKGFDSHIPGEGLLIYHVSISDKDIFENTVNNKHPQRVYPIAAHSRYNQRIPEPEFYGNINSPLTPFPSFSIYKNTEFSDTSTPSSTLWNGDKLGKPVFDIQHENGLISFAFYKAIYELYLTASLTNNKVSLSWKTPETDKKIEGYNIYRDGKLIQTTTNTVYRENLSSNGIYLYGVAVKFANEESATHEIQVSYGITGLNEIKDTSLNIYPLFLKKGDFLHIDRNDNTYANFTIHSMAGQILLQKEINTPYSQHVINLQSGIYILTVGQGQYILTRKLVIE